MSILKIFIAGCLIVGSLLGQSGSAENPMISEQYQDYTLTTPYTSSRSFPTSVDDREHTTVNIEISNSYQQTYPDHSIYTPVRQNNYGSIEQEHNTDYTMTFKGKSLDCSDLCLTGCCFCTACTGATIGTAAIFCAAAGIIITPTVLAFLSDRSEPIALASAIYNSVIVFLSIIHGKESKNGCSPLLYIGATVVAWIYWSQWHNGTPLNGSLQIANAALTCTAMFCSLLFYCCCAEKKVKS